MSHPYPGAPRALFVLSALLLAQAALAAPQVLSLEKIMADPDWIGTPVRDAYWSADGNAAYFSQKRQGSPLVDLHRVDLKGGHDQVVEAAAQAQADGPPVFAAGNRRAAFVRNGDVFLREAGRLRQISRTGAVDGSPQFSADGALLSFREKNQWFVHDLASGLTAPVAALEVRKDPDAAPEPDDLRDFQLRTFSTLKRLHDEKHAQTEHERDERRADTTRAAALLPGRGPQGRVDLAVAGWALPAGRDHASVCRQGARGSADALRDGVRIRRVRDGTRAGGPQPDEASVAVAARPGAARDSRAQDRYVARHQR